MVILFTEQSFVLLPVEIKSESTPGVTNGGSFGFGKDMVSLRSMEIISEVVGLSIASSCTQRSAT